MKYYFVVKYPGGRWEVKHLTLQEFYQIQKMTDYSTSRYTKQSEALKTANRRNKMRYLMS